MYTNLSNAEYINTVNIQKEQTIEIHTLEDLQQSLERYNSTNVGIGRSNPSSIQKIALFSRIDDFAYRLNAICNVHGGWMDLMECRLDESVNSQIEAMFHILPTPNTLEDFESAAIEFAELQDILTMKEMRGTATPDEAIYFAALGWNLCIYQNIATGLLAPAIVEYNEYQIAGYNLSLPATHCEHPTIH